MGSSANGGARPMKNPMRKLATVTILLAASLIFGIVLIVRGVLDNQDEVRRRDKRVEVLEQKIWRVCLHVQGMDAMSESWKKQPVRSEIGELLSIANSGALKECKEEP